MKTKQKYVQWNKDMILKFKEFCGIKNRKLLEIKIIQENAVNKKIRKSRH